jgi:hypothetical protein
MTNLARESLKVEVWLGGVDREELGDRHADARVLAEIGDNLFRAFAEEIRRGGARGWGDDAVHRRADGGAQTDQGILDDDALVGGNADAFAGEVVNERIGLFANDVVASHDDVHAGETVGADDRVDDFFETGFGRRRANADGDGRIRDGFIHESEHPRAGDGDFLDNLLVNFRLFVLQRVDEGVAVLIRRRRFGEHGGRRPRVLSKVPLHLWFAPTHGVLKHVVVLHHPLHRRAVNLELERLERAVVRQSVQFLSLDDDAVAIKEQREPRVRRRGRRRVRDDGRASSKGTSDDRRRLLGRRSAANRRDRRDASGR